MSIYQSLYSCDSWFRDGFQKILVALSELSGECGWYHLCLPLKNSTTKYTNDTKIQGLLVTSNARSH